MDKKKRKKGASLAGIALLTGTICFTTLPTLDIHAEQQTKPSIEVSSNQSNQSNQSSPYFKDAKIIKQYQLSDKLVILHQQEGVLSADGDIWTIMLLGQEFPESQIYYTNLTIVAQNPKDGSTIVQALPEDANEGYEPTFTLVHVANGKQQGILVEAPTGGSGGIVNYLLYQLQDNQLMLTFSNEMNAPKMDFRFLDNYQLKLYNYDLNRVMQLPITENKEQYDEAGIYDNGKVLQAKPQDVVMIDPYGKVTPIDIDNDGIMELQGIQSISAIYHANGVGYLISTWKWSPEDSSFHLINIEAVSTLPELLDQGDK